MFNRIRELREKRNMTQADLGKAVGVSRENVSRYENGLRVPPSDNMIRIADVLGVSLDELVGRTPPDCEVQRNG